MQHRCLHFYRIFCLFLLLFFFSSEIHILLFTCFGFVRCNDCKQLKGPKANNSNVVVIEWMGRLHSSVFLALENFSMKKFTEIRFYCQNVNWFGWIEVFSILVTIWYTIVKCNRFPQIQILRANLVEKCPFDLKRVPLTWIHPIQRTISLAHTHIILGNGNFACKWEKRFLFPSVCQTRLNK